MTIFSPSSDSPNRLPRWLIGSVVGICLLPILLKLAGVNFGLTDSGNLDPTLLDVPPDQLSDTIYHALGGSFLQFTQEDFPKLLNSMKTGTTRIRDIVSGLRTFSRIDESPCKEIDLHESIDSTLTFYAVA